MTISHLQFRKEEDAEKAVKDLNNRWFGGRPIYAELSPVTDFREACCRQYEMGECTRSGFWDDFQCCCVLIVKGVPFGPGLG